MNQAIIEAPTRHVEWAEPLQCFANVDRMVEENGGRKRLGWTVKERPLFIEHIHHAIWEDAEGNCWEITPDAAGVTRFLPDDEAHPVLFPGMKIGVTLPSRFYPIGNDKGLHRMCECLSRGSDAFFWGDVERGNYWMGRASGVGSRFVGQGYRVRLQPWASNPGDCIC